MKDLNFKQHIILAIIAGLFVVLAALLSKSQSSSSVNHYSSNNQNITNTAIANGENAVAISNNGGSSSIPAMNIKIQNNKTQSSNNAVSVNGSGNVTVNQNSYNGR